MFADPLLSQKRCSVGYISAADSLSYRTYIAMYKDATGEVCGLRLTLDLKMSHSHTFVLLDDLDGCIKFGRDQHLITLVKGSLCWSRKAVVDVLDFISESISHAWMITEP